MKVIIIGAGAAGLTAAIKAATNGADVTVLEHENKPGKKIMITGNGKCNITNTNLNSQKYYGDREFIDNVLAQFDATDTIKFFHDMGVITKNKNGYIYPQSGQASTVLNTLRDTAIHLGVSIKTNNQIEKIEKKNTGFDVHIGIVMHCDKLILATGGMSYPKTGSTGEGYKLAENFGHTIKEPKPALTALICDKTSLLKASGVRVYAKVSVKNNAEILGTDEGEIQITDYGISGIPVFNISRMTKSGSEIAIDFMPDYDDEKTNTFITNILAKRSFMSVSQALNGYFSEKLIYAFLDSLNISKTQRAGEITDIQIVNLSKKIKNYTLCVKSRRGFDFSQITQGGIDTNEINVETMESKLVNNLYFAGEILDVDGICGGYNLQFAWATGAIAGGNCHE